jgi:hypothetical protein
VGLGAGLDKCGKSRPTGIRSPELPVRSETLYGLGCPGSLPMYRTVSKLRYTPLQLFVVSEKSLRFIFQISLQRFHGREFKRIELDKKNNKSFNHTCIGPCFLLRVQYVSD